MERKNRLPPVHPGEIIKDDILPAVCLAVPPKYGCGCRLPTT
jgi:hypothetical protein